MSKTIKIVTWNMGYWQYRKFHDTAWQYLRNVIKPDIGFLQETRLPQLSKFEEVVFQEIHQKWGTALYCLGAKVKREITLECYSDRVAAAEVELAPIKTLFIASIHAPIINNRVFPHLDNIFTEIEIIFSGHPSLIGGDLNTARLAEITWPGYGHGPFFDRVDSSLYEDIRMRFHEDEIQTIFRPNQITPFQNDHIFISRDLAGHVLSYNVLKNETTRKVSDHIPVVVEIKI